MNTTLNRVKSIGFVLLLIYVPLVVVLGLASANFEYREYREYITGIKPFEAKSPPQTPSNLDQAHWQRVRDSLFDKYSSPDGTIPEGSINNPVDFFNMFYNPSEEELATLRKRIQTASITDELSTDQVYIRKNGDLYCRYSSFSPRINNESYSYTESKPVYFRPFKTFFTEVYLSPEEQDSIAKLRMNMIGASAIYLLWMFLAILIILGFIVFIQYPVELHKSIDSHSPPPT